MKWLHLFVSLNLQLKLLLYLWNSVYFRLLAWLFICRSTSFHIGWLFICRSISVPCGRYCSSVVHTLNPSHSHTQLSKCLHMIELSPGSCSQAGLVLGPPLWPAATPLITPAAQLSPRLVISACLEFAYCSQCSHIKLCKGVFIILQPLPRQNRATIGQPIRVTVHLQFVENYEDLLQILGFPRKTSDC